MTAAAKKTRAPAAAAAHPADDEITIERRVRLPAPTAPTRKIDKVDERLLAIARGELEPEDPFGGLIPIYDDDLANEVEDGWPSLQSVSDAPEEMLFCRSIPNMRMTAGALRALPISEEALLFAEEINGLRTISELADACHLQELDSLEIIDELLRYGAIELY